VPFGQFGRTQGDGDQVVAPRALNLFPGELFVRLQMLLAVRTGEFEFAHDISVFVRQSFAPEAASAIHANSYPKTDSTSRKKCLILFSPRFRIV
jgi:hypothetical protein